MCLCCSDLPGSPAVVRGGRVVYESFAPLALLLPPGREGGPCASAGASHAALFVCVPQQLCLVLERPLPLPDTALCRMLRVQARPTSSKMHWPRRWTLVVPSLCSTLRARWVGGLSVMLQTLLYLGQSVD